MSKLIGPGENQVSTNGLLGDLAFQDAKALVVKPQAGSEPQRAGDMVFKRVGDTEIQVKIKGDDGEVRGISLPVAKVVGKPVLDMANGSGKLDLKPVFVADFTRGPINPHVAFSRPTEAQRTDRNKQMAQTLAGVPRLNFDANTGVRVGMLVEPGSTNIMMSSHPLIRLGNAVAEHVEEPTGLFGRRWYRKIGKNYAMGWPDIASTVVPDGPLTLSFFSDQSTPAEGYISDAWGGYKLTSVVLNAGGAGIHRHYATFSGPAGSTVIHVRNIFQGNAFGGFQLEPGAVVTSHIPTDGTQVTRAADNLTIPLDDSWFNRQEGTLYVEFGENPSAETMSSSAPFYLSVGIVNSTLGDGLLGFGVAPGRRAVYRPSSGQGAAQYAETSATLSRTKAAFSYSSGVQRSAFGDTSIAPSNANLQGALSNVGRIYINPAYSGIIKEIRYYDKALTDAQLQTLTA